MSIRPPQPTPLQQAQLAVLHAFSVARVALDPIAFRLFVDYVAAVTAAEATRCVNWENAGFDLDFDGPEDAA